jgi:hypothetical protein
LNRQTITLAIAESEMAKLQKIAQDLNCMWGEKPNVSKLIKKIAEGELEINTPEYVKPKMLDPKQVEAIKASIAHFTNIGDFQKVSDLAQLLIPDFEG